MLSPMMPDHDDAGDDGGDEQEIAALTIAAEERDQGDDRGYQQHQCEHAQQPGRRAIEHRGQCGFAAGSIDEVRRVVANAPDAGAGDHDRGEGSEPEQQRRPPPVAGDDDRERDQRDGGDEQHHQATLGEDERALGAVHRSPGIGETVAPVDDELTEVLRQVPAERRLELGDLLREDRRPRSTSAARRR